MTIFDYARIKPFLFRLDPETAHHLAMKSLETMQRSRPALRRLARKHAVEDERLAQTIWGLEFDNPVGLAAGFDKDARVIPAMAAMGFGFVEIGTVTPRPQPGNPKPRLFRLAREASLQNAMGFNNAGMARIAGSLGAVQPHPVPVGVNIGKNKDTPVEKVLEDYLQLLEHFAALGDYFVINVSSPNTPGLRDFQNEEFVSEVLREAVNITDKPVLLKITPDAETEQLVALAEAAVDSGASGIIATNTTTDYGLSAEAKGFGGISGQLLRDKSRATLKALADRLHRRTVIVSAGGIDNAEEAYSRLRMGASLVQVYTALIYRGPGIVKTINDGLVRLLEEDGVANVSDVIGLDARG